MQLYLNDNTCMFSQFDRTPVCDGQTGEHGAITYIMLAWCCMVKISQNVLYRTTTMSPETYFLVNLNVY